MGRNLLKKTSVILIHPVSRVSVTVTVAWVLIGEVVCIALLRAESHVAASK